MKNAGDFLPCSFVIVLHHVLISGKTRNSQRNMEWFEKPVDEALKELQTDEKGLSEKEAEERLKKYGLNVLPEKKKATALQVFLEQFRNYLVIILIAAAVISFFVGEALDGSAIIAIVILNAAFGFLQERKAEKTLEALRKFAAPKTKVLRKGEITTIDSSHVVPGDILVLEVGDKIPADARIIELSNLKIDESVLTGESNPVEKELHELKGKLAVADRKNMVFSGTTAVYGRCKAVVVGTGSTTEFGKIASALQGRDEPTPLQNKLEVLGKNLGTLIIGICALVFFAGILQGDELLEMFLVAVSLAVAAIPEGLPAVVTITLAIGLMRMVKKNAIIRKLPAVETLGSTTFICSDKTGTLTKNEMTVRKVYADGKIIDVSGEGYETKGSFTLEGKETENEGLGMLLTVGLMCNNSSIGKERVGDPTELALLVSAKKYGFEDTRKDSKRVAEMEFDSERKMMSIVYHVNNRNVLYAKGAVEEVLKRCTHIYKGGSIQRIHDDDKSQILMANEVFASSALRVLAFAVKKIGSEKPREEDLTFVGLQGMIDPPRPEVKQSIEKCRMAGINVVMITGDHKDTAAAVAKELSIINDDKEILTGQELDALKENEFEKMVERIRVYARVSPEHKVKICEALKKKGHVVAMTGDGVNDAPALKKADIGVAMGIAGTDVAKEASDMILTDDNFSSIVSAVEEGRGIYDNIKKFINYLLACNIGEVAVVFGGILLSLPLPLLPLQLLWMNLVTDGLPAIALGMEPYGAGIMKRKPRNPKEKVLDRRSLEFVMIVGVLIGAVTLYLFYLELPDVARARSVAFSTLVILEMAVALSFRSPEYLFSSKIGDNKIFWISIVSSILLQFLIVQVPFFNPIFDTTPLSLTDWSRIFVAAFAVFVLIEINKVLEIQKHIFRRKDA